MHCKSPVSVYAGSNDKVLSQLGTKDSTFGIFTMDDGTIFSMNISWALPVVWPGSVYGLEIGIIGTKGVIDIEAEKTRLSKALEASAKEAKSLEGRLSNANFVERAKPEAVEKTRADHAHHVAEVARLEAALARLG